MKIVERIPAHYEVREVEDLGRIYRWCPEQVRLSDLENYPYEEIVPYREFNVDCKLYCFTPSGFLYRREPGPEEVGGFFCGYLTSEAWHYRAYQG